MSFEVNISDKYAMLVFQDPVFSSQIKFCKNTVFRVPNIWKFDEVFPPKISLYLF